MNAKKLKVKMKDYAKDFVEGAEQELREAESLVVGSSPVELGILSIIAGFISATLTLTIMSGAVVIKYVFVKTITFAVGMFLFLTGLRWFLQNRPRKVYKA